MSDDVKCSYRANSYIKVLLIFASLVCGSLFCGSLVSGSMAFADDDTELDFNRENYGQSDFPLWSELSPFEEWFLSRAQSAAQGDAQAMLALFWLASGQHRDQQSFEEVNRQLDTWLASQQNVLQKKRKLLDKAELLHHAMHRDFFLNNDDGETLIGYDADQSRLSEIFASKTFNCISSSLLYLVLARKLDWPVEAVLLPSHSYVQLRNQNDIIEIETTSINGFNVVHDEDFYANSDQQWFSDRNLEPTTYADYLARDIISAFELGLYNMWSQHTQPERMAYPDRLRLAEIRGYLQADDMDAQLNRVNFYQRELGHLNRQQEVNTAARLSKIISPLLARLENHIDQHPMLNELWIGLQTEVALHNIQAGDLERGLLLAKSLLNRLPTLPEHKQRLQDNILIVVSHYVVASLATHSYENTRLAIIDIESECLDNPSCSQSMGQLYSSWAKVFWEREDWRNAALILSDYVQLKIDDINYQTFLKNAELAYVNDAKTLVWDGDWEIALQNLGECENKLPTQQRCSAEIKRIKEQRHLGNL